MQFGFGASIYCHPSLRLHLPDKLIGSVDHNFLLSSIEAGPAWRVFKGQARFLEKRA